MYHVFCWGGWIHLCGIWENLPCLPCRFLALSAKCRYSVTSSESTWKKGNPTARIPRSFEIACIGSHRKSLFIPKPIHNISNPNCWNVATANTTKSVSVQQIVTSLQPCWTWSSILVFYGHVIMRRQIRECYFMSNMQLQMAFSYLVWIETSDGLKYIIFQMIWEFVQLDSLDAFTGCDTVVSAFCGNGKKSA